MFKRILSILGVFLLIGFLGAGCASLGIGKLPSVCDDMTEPSRLCELANKYDVRLEDVGNGLIIANAVAISQELYTKEQAIEVIKELRAALDNPVSYAFFKGEVYLKVDTYPGLLEVASVYFSEIGGITQIMYKKDQELLSGWLDQQVKLLGG